jgi:hypothetical protein
MLPFAQNTHEHALVLRNSSLPDNDKSIVDAEIGSILKTGVLRKGRPQVLAFC